MIENRKNNWKGSDKLTLVKIGDKKIVEMKNRFYNYDDICEALVISPVDMKYADAETIIDVLNDKNRIKSAGKIVEGTRYDWGKIDPRTGMPKIKEPRIEDSIELMNRKPGQTGWIIVLQNRVNWNSVGNIRYRKKVWYDRRDCTISSDETKEDAVRFEQYVLPHCGRPGGWVYANDPKFKL